MDTIMRDIASIYLNKYIVTAELTCFEEKRHQDNTSKDEAIYRTYITSKKKWDRSNVNASGRFIYWVEKAFVETVKSIKYRKPIDNIYIELVLYTGTERLDPYKVPLYLIDGINLIIKIGNLSK